MMDLAKDILTKSVPEGRVAVYFIGQAGFVFKSDDNKLTAVDLYLSDCCERYFGFKRLIPKLLDASDLVFDVVIATHEHLDHFDVDSMPMLTAHADTVLYTPEGGLEECAKLNITGNTKLLQTGNIYTEGILKIEPVFCDHRDLSRTAVGLILYIGSVCIYIAGDTAYRPEMIGDIADRGVDLMIAPINGAYGNLDEKEAVMLCSVIRPKLAVPCHYWCFAEHGGDPGLYAEHMKKILPDQRFILMGMGSSIMI